MERVRIVESLKYGGRVFVYFLAVVLIGGSGIGLGAAVGWNAASVSVTGGDLAVHDGPELAAGVVLVLLGSAALFTGLFGIAHKLIADSTAEGMTNATGPTQAAQTESAAAAGGSGAATTDERVADEPSTAASPDPERTTVADGATADGTTSPEDDRPATGEADASAGTQPRAGEDQSTTSAAGGRSASAEPSSAGAGRTATAEPESGRSTAEEAPSAPAAEVDHPAGHSGSEPSGEEFRERTAEQIAFGTDNSAGEASTEPDSPGESRGEKAEEKPTDADGEPETAGPAVEAGKSDDGAAADGADDEPAIVTEDRVTQEDQVSDDENEDVDLFEGNGDAEEGEPEDVTVVPEYDEISADQFGTDSADQGDDDGDGIAGDDAEGSEDGNGSGEDPLDPFE